MLLRFLIVAFVVSFAAPARPTSAQVEHDFEIWAALFATAQVFPEDRGPVFWFDAHARRGSPGTVAILRPGVGYAFASWASLWVGYAWIPRWGDVTGTRRDEQRVWEQVIFDYRGKPSLWLQSRTRFEQRFFDIGNNTAHRFRQLVRLNYRPKKTVPVGTAFWDEVFVGMQGADWAKQGFDQNRGFLGLAIFGPDRFRVEVGYLNVFVARQDDVMAHVLSINLFYSFKPEY